MMDTLKGAALVATFLAMLATFATMNKERVQDVLDGRRAKKSRRVKHDFAFSGLITCGHCGCSIVA